MGVVLCMIYKEFGYKQDGGVLCMNNKEFGYKQDGGSIMHDL